ncbi:URA2 [Symbiodinium necroappetens]|uniref:URA2 protein n=1 Tax=Symbiodinium necroappetens TaxID=1628268 RepID=A0A812M927_9DINO|nr:URA2 [Symbiodinium necroappetens]
MAMASELLKNATEARKTWVKRQTERFAQACQRRLRDSHGFETTATLKIFAPTNTKRGALKAAEELKHSLDEQGFVAPQVQVEALLKGMVFRLSMQASLVKDATDDGTGGLRGHCPICLGSKVLVALAPCGHTVCQDCKPTVCSTHRPTRRKQCPMCRAFVEATTAGIFVS